MEDVEEERHASEHQHGRSEPLYEVLLAKASWAMSSGGSCSTRQLSDSQSTTHIDRREARGSSGRHSDEQQPIESRVARLQGSIARLSVPHFHIRSMSWRARQCWRFSDVITRHGQDDLHSTRYIARDHRRRGQRVPHRPRSSRPRTLCVRSPTTMTEQITIECHSHSNSHTVRATHTKRPRR